MEANKKPPANPFSIAIRLLARRPYAVAEMRRSLIKRFPDKVEVDAAVARLREAGYLDDRKFARQFASFLVRNRAFGRERVRLELKSRLVDYRFIEEAIEQAFEETPEQTLLERALEKKLRTVRLPLTQRKFYSLAQSLMRLGFRSDAIMKAMRSRPELKPVAENIDSLDR
ncbi:MAG TPA: RecX family transcriptional regulator [Terriglobia bacterium]|nr:RecX family transcriptional regulator [Terriglobia bacterium]